MDETGPIEGFAQSFREVVGGVFPSSIVWWSSAAKTTKILEKIIARDSKKKPTTITRRLYAADGVTALVEAVDTITYSGPFETSRTRAVN